MKTMFLTHTENGYVDPNFFGEYYASINVKLFKKIAEQIKKLKIPIIYIHGGDTVYPAIDKALNDSERIEGFNPNESFLIAKEIALQRGLEPILAGVSSDSCIRLLYNIMTGKRDQSYEFEAKKLGWDYKELKRIHYTPLTTVIRNDLID